MESRETNSPSRQTRSYPTPSVFTRISYSLQLWALKLFVKVIVPVHRFFQPHSVRLSQTPTLSKTYPCRPRLKNRIFIPREHKSGELLPLYINVHGGGFALCDPLMDDEFCSILANRFKIIVVSINYSKAPSVSFPVPTHDIVAIAQAVIEDDTMPINPLRVAMGGFSAGGNLCFSAVQLPAIKARIKALVTFYPVLDFSISPEQKQAAWHKPGEKDYLIGIARMFDYGYIPSGQDLRDPLLSPSFARKEDLPDFVYCIGAERDMLANEERSLMCKLAGIDTLTDEEKYEFERGTYKWKLVRGTEHSFTHKTVSNKVVEQKRVETLNETVGSVGEWLFDGPFRQ